MATHEELKDKLKKAIVDKRKLEDEEYDLLEAIWSVTDDLNFPTPRGRVWTTEQKARMGGEIQDLEEQLAEVKNELNNIKGSEEELKEALLFVINSRGTSSVPAVDAVLGDDNLRGLITSFKSGIKGGKYRKRKSVRRKSVRRKNHY